MGIKRGFGALAASVLMVMLTSTSAFAQHHPQIDVRGEWEVEGLGWMLEVDVEGEAITGVLTLGAYGSFPWEEGALDGDRLRIEVNAGGNLIVFEGTVSGDEYKGEMTGMHAEPFVARRGSSGPMAQSWDLEKPGALYSASGSGRTLTDRRVPAGVGVKVTPSS